MGSLTPVITGLTEISRVVGTVAPIFGAASDIVGSVRQISGQEDDSRRKNLRAQQDLMLRQLQQQQNLKTATAGEQAVLERERLAAEAASADEQRRAALRRAVARQRASFGAQGVGAGDGSSEAVLLGLFEETEADKARREKMDQIRNRFISQDLSAQSRINVLQRSQLQEKQRLERALLTENI